MFKKRNLRIAANGNHLQGVGLTPAKLGEQLAWKKPLIIGIFCRLAGKVDLRGALAGGRRLRFGLLQAVLGWVIQGLMILAAIGTLLVAGG